jgi:putative acetyltransferase
MKQMNMRIVLRPARLEDFDYCSDLYFAEMERTIADLKLDKAAHAASFRGRWEATEVRLIMLDGADIGWLQATTNEDALYLGQLFVAPAFQRQGIGTEVMKHLIIEATFTGRSVTLGVVKTNPALRLYRRLGFQTTNEDDRKFHMRRETGLATAGPSTLINVRHMHDEDAHAFLQVHHAAVRGIAAKDYPPAVIEHWAPLPITQKAVDAVRANCENETRILAEISGEIVGMGAIILAKNELRACYVAPDAARKGVGSALVQEIERIARERGLGRLDLDASLTSEPFYAHHGYDTRERGEHVLRSGQRMACVKMRKDLSPTGRSRGTQRGGRGS